MTVLLLDTHAFVWFIGGSDKLSHRARLLMEDETNRLLLSAASLWEIGIKVSIGKLDLGEPFDQLIPRQLAENEIEILSITLSHVARLLELPFHHRDPFDRVLIAQAATENCPLISADPIRSVWDYAVVVTSCRRASSGSSKS